MTLIIIAAVLAIVLALLAFAKPQGHWLRKGVGACFAFLFFPAGGVLFIVAMSILGAFERPYSPFETLGLTLVLEIPILLVAYLLLETQKNLQDSYLSLRKNQRAFAAHVLELAGHGYPHPFITTSLVLWAIGVGSISFLAGFHLKTLPLVFIVLVLTDLVKTGNLKVTAIGAFYRIRSEMRAVRDVLSH